MSIGKQPVKCSVCAAPAAASPGAQGTPEAYPACHAIACRMIVSQHGQMGEAGFKHYLKLHVDALQRRQINLEQGQIKRRLRDDENTWGWTALHRTAAEQAGEFLRLVLPSGPRRAARVGAARRARYRAHLEFILAEASQPTATDDAGPTPDIAQQHATPGTSSMPGRLCAMCGGGCCTRGADSAYLSAATIRILKLTRPSLSDADILGLYLSHVPPRSREGSCINHTRNGCSLPRELRSITCNRYACEALARLQHAQASSGQPVAVFIVQRRLDNWQQGAQEHDNPVTSLGRLTEAGLQRYSPEATGKSSGLGGSVAI
jgi:hypothetical protein